MISDISSDILSDILSDISSGIWPQRVAVEVRQGTLGAAGRS